MALGSEPINQKKFEGGASGVCGFLLGFLRRRSGVRFPYPPVLEKCAKGFVYAIFFG